MGEALTVDKVVQHALDKQSEIVSGLVTRTDAGFTEVRAAMADTIAKVEQYTSGDAPKRVQELTSHREMIEQQFAGQMLSLREELKRQVDELEAAFNVKTSGGTADPANDVGADPRSQIAEKMYADGAHTEILQRKAERTVGYMKPVKIPSLIAAPPDIMRVLSETELGPLTPRFRRSDVVFHLRERSDIVSLLRRVPTGGRDRYEFARQKLEGLYGAHATTVDGAHISSVTTISLVDASRLLENSFLRFFTTAGAIGKFIAITGNDVVISDTPGGAPSALGVSLAGGEQASSEQYEHTPELAAKVEGTDAYEELEQILINMATLIPVSEQRLISAPQFQAFINRELVARANRNMDYQLLYGAGTGLRTDVEQPGWINETGAQTLTWASGDTNDTRADLILRLADLINSDDDGDLTAIMNKRDWTTLVKAKGTDGHYVTNRGPVLITDEPGRRFVGPHAVRRSGFVNLTDVFLIDPAVASEIADLEDANLAMGHDNDDFSKNIVRIRYDHRMLHAILSTTGYAIGTWDSQP
ncbi:MAG: phage major capsid protein [Kiloniellales bacterium]